MLEEVLRIVGGIIVGLVIILGSLACIQMLSTTPLWGEGGAAWVQAIGAIAAIVGSVAIATRQERYVAAQALKAAQIVEFQKADDSLDLATGAYSLGNEILKCIAELTRILKARKFKDGPLVGDELSQLIGSLQIYAAKPISAAVLQPVLELQRKCSALLTLINGVHEEVVTDLRNNKALALEVEAQKIVKRLGIAMRKAEKIRNGFSGVDRGN